MREDYYVVQILPDGRPGKILALITAGCYKTQLLRLKSAGFLNRRETKIRTVLDSSYRARLFKPLQLHAVMYYSDFLHFTYIEIENEG
ncbi:MAG: hypothetical protein U9O65_00770 [Thermotogota bacterium]|nr:hypothetical protein [Thermotogota bacterium]